MSEVKPPRNTRNGNPEHWMPANKRRGLSLRPKKGFSTAKAALRFARKGAHEMIAYPCGECGEWHLASRYFRGEDRAEKPGSIKLGSITDPHWGRTHS